MAAYTFYKAHGLGNDFLVVFAEPNTARLINYPALAQWACTRHTGIGADGLLLLTRKRDGNSDFALRFFNADGSEAEMSGNGIRCAAAVLHYTNIFTDPLLRLQTLSGIKTVALVSAQAPDFEFTVNMGSPRFAPTTIPLNLPGIETLPQLIRFPLECHYPDYPTLPVTALSMGNPHCSIFVEDLGHSDFTRLDWASLGKQLERHPAFPQRTNVEFIQVLDMHTLAVRFWERGVGITNSSGTGASAAAVAAVLNGYTHRKLTVITLAGKLHLHWQDDDTVALTGPATIICRGEAFWEP